MTNYIVILVILISAGGIFLYSTQTALAPVQESGGEDPFGDGATEVGITGSTQTETGAQETTSAPEVISRTELAKHSTQADCWIGYKGTVYDITNWLPKHPGSAGAIAPFCGTADEFAAAFNKQHGTKREVRLEKEGVKEGALGN